MTTKTELSPKARESKNAQDMQVDEVLIPRKVPSLCSARYGIALVLHLCNFTTIAQNVVMNITMVAMVNSTSLQSQFNGSSEGLPVDSFGDLSKAPKSLSAKDPEFGWRNVFFLLFAINLSGLIFYLIFGEADVQDWAKERKLTRL
uniref:Solute carrier family 17 member 3 n=1 Tax=Piliocolobus tephrosceles TaxID=591936 RepID=A0A8C9GCH7_9PRIM